MTKALFVDSLKKEITEVNIDTLKDIQKAVGGYYTVMSIKGGMVYVDEEGMMKDPATRGFFSIKGYHPIIGNALIVGPIKRSDHTDVTISLDEAKAMITYITFDDYRRFLAAH